MRAVVAATEWAIANPEATVRIAEALCSECGFFEFNHELFRFNEEVKLSLESTPEGHIFGATHAPTVAQEVSAMRSFGILDTLPDMSALFDNSYIFAVHDENGDLIWPGPIGE